MYLSLLDHNTWQILNSNVFIATLWNVFVTYFKNTLQLLRRTDRHILLHLNSGDAIVEECNADITTRVTVQRQLKNKVEYVKAAENCTVVPLLLCCLKHF